MNNFKNPTSDAPKFVKLALLGADIGRGLSDVDAKISTQKFFGIFARRKRRDLTRKCFFLC